MRNFMPNSSRARGYRAVESRHRPRRHERADRCPLDGSGAKVFAKYGTDAQVIFIRQAPMLLAGMSAGDVQIAATGGTSALLAASGGMDVKVVASVNGRVTYDLVAAPSIKRLVERQTSAWVRNPAGRP